MDKFLGWRTSTNNAKNYVESIDNMLSSKEKFSKFRQHNRAYGQILEHLTHKDGLIYYNYILQNYPHLLKMIGKFKENDNVGSPIIFDYGVGGLINPTTLRYIKFAGDIEKKFGDLNGVNLVEIGGGYGGLVNVLSKLYSFNSIKLFDLPSPLKLQKKYLNKFNIDVETYTINDDFNIEDNTLTISNYAWCECDRQTRDLYVEKIINKSKYIYMLVYDVDIDNELMTLKGNNKLTKDILNGCPIFCSKK